MKKILTLITAALAFAAVFAGCAAESGISGTYRVTGLSAGEVSLAESEIAQFYSDVSFEFKTDGVCVMNTPGYKDSGTYSVDGEKITVTFGESDTSGRVDGDTIVIEQGGIELTLEKE